MNDTMIKSYPVYANHLRAARYPAALQCLPVNGRRNVLFCTGSRGAVGYYRCYLPSVFLHRYSKDFNAVTVGALDDKDVYLDWADIIVWNELYDDYNHAAFERARSAGKINLYEIDDFMHASFGEKSFFAGYTPDTPAHKRMIRWMNDCDGMIVSTDYLRDCYSGMVDVPVRTVHNAVDIDRLEKMRSTHVFDNVRILWQGGPSHYEDLLMLVNPLARIKDEYGRRVKITLYGFDGKRRDRDGKWHIADIPFDHFAPGDGIDDFFTRMGDMGQHIGLCPLVDDEFNLAKSNLKWLDYSSFGMATIASNVGPYRASITHDVDGLLVDNTDDAWYAALKTLIDNAQKRELLSAAAQASVRRSYNARTRWIEYDALFNAFSGGTV